MPGKTAAQPSLPNAGTAASGQFTGMPRIRTLCLVFAHHVTDGFVFSWRRYQTTRLSASCRGPDNHSNMPTRICLGVYNLCVRRDWLISVRFHMIIIDEQQSQPEPLPGRGLRSRGL